MIVNASVASTSGSAPGTNAGRRELDSSIAPHAIAVPLTRFLVSARRTCSIVTVSLTTSAPRVPEFTTNHATWMTTIAAVTLPKACGETRVATNSSEPNHVTCRTTWLAPIHDMPRVSTACSGAGAVVVTRRSRRACGTRAAAPRRPTRA